MGYIICITWASMWGTAVLGARVTSSRHISYSLLRIAGGQRRHLYDHRARRVPAPVLQLPLGYVELLNIQVKLRESAEGSEESIQGECCTCCISHAPSAIFMLPSCSSDDLGSTYAEHT